MPFRAIERSNDGIEVDITDYPEPKRELEKLDLVCPGCGVKFMIKHTIAVKPHFAHYSRGSCRIGVGESEIHREVKRAIKRKLRSLKAYRGARIRFEVYIKGIDRIADVLVEFDNGIREIHEAQVSPITTDILRERTNDYNRAGFDVVWWLSLKALTRTNKEFIADNYGYTAIIETSYKEA